MSEKQYRLPAIAWLRVTDYMHGWLQHELGGEARIGEKRVVCIQHLDGARRVLRMETEEQREAPRPVGCALSATWKNALDAGLKVDAAAMEREYGVTRESLALYAPIECPKLCLTKNGVLRPWTHEVTFERQQATALLRLLRNEFWAAVEEFDREYAQLLEGKKYPAIDMIEAFCNDTNTPDVYVPAMRREWQRRVKRKASSSS